MKIYRKVLILIMFIFSIFTLSLGLNNNELIASTNYYSGISSSLEKDDLKLALRDLITSTHTYISTYVDCKTPSIVEKTDGDPNNSGKIILYWSGLSIASTWDGGTSWNREHVWPKSNSWFYESGAGSDLHHLRPADPDVNSSHNNNPYGEVPGENPNVDTASINGKVMTDCELANSVFEPAENKKGDTARIIFYLLTRYSEADAYLDNDESNGELSQVVVGELDLLLQWNIQDPVDASEIRRNDAVQEIQGNRNPFIDNSDYANIIWGEGSLGNGGNEGGNSGSDEEIENNSSKFKLVSDVSTLKVGNKVIIASNNYSVALSTTQNNNNRGQANVSIVDACIEPGADVQVLTLEEGTVDNTFAFNTGNGYLTAESSSGNYLRTQSSLSDNSSFSISINNGLANIVAQGTNTRNTIRYNSGSSLFSCYSVSNSQQDVSLYMQEQQEDVPVENPFEEFEAMSTKTSIMMNYTKEISENQSDVSYTFTSKIFNASNETQSLNGISWTNVNDGNYYGYESARGQQIGSGGSPASSLTLTSEELSNVKSIVINTSGSSSTNAELTVTVGSKQVGNTVLLTSSDAAYTFTCDEPLNGAITLAYSQTSSKAMYIKGITITFAGGVETYQMTSAGIRFGTCITKDMFDEYNDENTVWGVEYYIGSVSNWETVNAKQVVCNPARVAYEGSNVADENGEYYQFALVFTGIDYTKIDTLISARVYVTVNGETHYMQSTAYSFREVVNKYLSLDNTSSCEEHLGILNHISNYQE